MEIHFKRLIKSGKINTVFHKKGVLISWVIIRTDNTPANCTSAVPIQGLIIVPVRRIIVDITETIRFHIEGIPDPFQTGETTGLIPALTGGTTGLVPTLTGEITDPVLTLTVGITGRIPAPIGLIRNMAAGITPDTMEECPSRPERNPNFFPYFSVAWQLFLQPLL